MAAALGPVIDTLGVQYPGRQDRRLDPCVDDLLLLADRITSEVRGLFDRPVGFFGHSMGAVVAFEVARRLESAGLDLIQLIASGHAAPSRASDSGMHRLDDEHLRARLETLSGTDVRVLCDPELWPLIMPAVRADYKAIDEYACPPGAVLASDITALIGDTDPLTTFADAQAWREHTVGSFTLRVFPGDHFFLTTHTADVAAAVADLII